jgi:hypothetical protein
LIDAGRRPVVACYHRLEDAAALRARVNALNLQSERPDPFSTFEFLENFLAHDERRSASRSTLWFLTATVAGRLIGYVALTHERARFLGFPISKIGFAVTRDTDRPHVVALAGHLREVSDAFYRYLLERKRDWSLLEFQQQDGASSMFPPPACIAGNGLAVRQWPSLANGTISVRWSTFENYLRDLTKKNRSNFRRQVRRLLALGEVEVLASADPATTPALLELYRSIEPRSWKSAAHGAIGRHPGRVAYFQALLRPVQPMHVSIHLLLVDDLPVAGLISGAFAQGLYALHIIYDASLAHAAPGSLMLLMGVRQAIETRATHFNLLSGFGYFKVRWLATMTEARTGQIYRTDRLPFWRRVVGDCLRSVWRQPPASASAPFNPARRAAEGSGEDDVPATPPPVSAPERERLCALLRTARQHPHHTLSGPALAELCGVEP